MKYRDKFINPKKNMFSDEEKRKFLTIVKQEWSYFAERMVPKTFYFYKKV